MNSYISYFQEGGEALSERGRIADVTRRALNGEFKPAQVTPEQLEDINKLYNQALAVSKINRFLRHRPNSPSLSMTHIHNFVKPPRMDRAQIIKMAQDFWNNLHPHGFGDRTLINQVRQREDELQDQLQDYYGRFGYSSLDDIDMDRSPWAGYYLYDMLHDNYNPDIRYKGGMQYDNLVGDETFDPYSYARGGRVGKYKNPYEKFYAGDVKNINDDTILDNIRNNISKIIANEYSFEGKQVFSPGVAENDGPRYTFYTRNFSRNDQKGFKTMLAGLPALKEAIENNLSTINDEDSTEEMRKLALHQLNYNLGTLFKTYKSSSFTHNGIDNFLKNLDWSYFESSNGTSSGASGRTQTTPTITPTTPATSAQTTQTTETSGTTSTPNTGVAKLNINSADFFQTDNDDQEDTQQTTQQSSIPLIMRAQIGERQRIKPPQQQQPVQQPVPQLSDRYNGTGNYRYFVGANEGNGITNTNVKIKNNSGMKGTEALNAILNNAQNYTGGRKKFKVTAFTQLDNGKLKKVGTQKVVFRPNSKKAWETANPQDQNAEANAEQENTNAQTGEVYSAPEATAAAPNLTGTSAPSVSFLDQQTNGNTENQGVENEAEKERKGGEFYGRRRARQRVMRNGGYTNYFQPGGTVIDSSYFVRPPVPMPNPDHDFKIKPVPMPDLAPYLAPYYYKDKHAPMYEILPNYVPEGYDPFAPQKLKLNGELL